MSLFEAFRYDGKRALVVGGATGMGRAAAELLLDAGADVVVMDYAPVDLEGAEGIHVNLADKGSIDAAIVNAVAKLGIATSMVKNACTNFQVLLIPGSVN